MTRSLLWVMGLVVVTVAMWPTLRVPVQGDDFQSLFNIAPHYDGALVRMLDAGMPLDESGRCHLVELAGMIDNRRARESLNELYRDRHGQVFCTIPP